MVADLLAALAALGEVPVHSGDRARFTQGADDYLTRNNATIVWGRRKVERVWNALTYGFSNDACDCRTKGHGPNCALRLYVAAYIAGLHSIDIAHAQAFEHYLNHPEEGKRK